tara:strand:+ start:312 stop:935 length:624 start_codon:yes stop_codon:yes gene_type:complete
MKKLISILLFLASLSSGQTSPTVALSKGNPDAAYTSLYFYSTTYLTYICKTPAFRQRATYTWAVTPGVGQGTLTNVVVLTNVGTVTTSAAHGLTIGNRVTIAGATVDTDLNGSYYVQTVGSSTTFTITTASVANATYTDAGMSLYTTAPRTTESIWSIERFGYDGSNNLITDQFAVGNVTGGLATVAYSFVCDNRAATTGSTKVTYQ